MGCDIHLYVEARDKRGWLTRDEWKVEDGWTDVPFDSRFFNDRNYELFAILAGVRNKYDIKPIQEPRGLPSDCDPMILKANDSWGEDGHSHSWLTLAELLAFDWTQTITCSGWVNGIKFANWLRYDREHGEAPASYCGGVGGGGVKHLTELDLLKEVKAIQTRLPDYRMAEKEIEAKLGSCYAECKWVQPYYKLARRFWSDCIPRLIRLGKPEDVRIVFWFDN